MVVSDSLHSHGKLVNCFIQSAGGRIAQHAVEAVISFAQAQRVVQELKLGTQMMCLCYQGAGTQPPS